MANLPNNTYAPTGPCDECKLILAVEKWVHLAFDDKKRVTCPEVNTLPRKRFIQEVDFYF